MSTFGSHFRVTTYGESHCASVGCIVDGVPPGMALQEQDIQTQLSRRRPGQSALTTPVSVSEWYRLCDERRPSSDQILSLRSEMRRTRSRFNPASRRVSRLELRSRCSFATKINDPMTTPTKPSMHFPGQVTPTSPTSKNTASKRRAVVVGAVLVRQLVSLPYIPSIDLQPLTRSPSRRPSRSWRTGRKVPQGGVRH